MTRLGALSIDSEAIRRERNYQVLQAAALIWCNLDADFMPSNADEFAVSKALALLEEIERRGK